MWTNAPNSWSEFKLTKSVLLSWHLHITLDFSVRSIYLYSVHAIDSFVC